MDMMRDVMRYVERRLAGVRLAYRAVLSTLGKGAAVQLAQAEGLAGETVQAAELCQQFGFTSGPPPGTQLIILPLGGSTAHSVIVATEHGGYRLDVASGEACLYSMWGDKVHVRQERIEVETKTLHFKASEQVIFETPALSMIGTGGGAAAASFTGSLHTTGAVTSDGDHVAGGVSLEHHTHPGDSGGTTGEAR
jgi:phage baseplate assembly protein V